MDNPKQLCIPTNVPGICLPTAPSCIPGYIWQCNSGVCSCQPVERSCTVSITYMQGAPYMPTLVPMEAHCDAAGVEIAIVMMLAKLMNPLLH